MPRKEFEGQPLEGEGKMSEETRKQVFGRSEADEAPGSKEGTSSGTDRQHSGPSQAGSGKNVGQSEQ